MCLCDFIVAIKICERDVYQMYCNIHSSFQGDVFMNFQTLINCVHENINYSLNTHMNIGIDNLAI
jgi:hypothetical protein